MIESGHLEKNLKLDKKTFFEFMNNKIDTLNITKAIEEVKPFIKDNSVFDFWTNDYFKLLTERVQFY